MKFFLSLICKTVAPPKWRLPFSSRMFKEAFPLTAVWLAVFFMLAQGTFTAAEAQKKKEIKSEKKSSGKTIDPSQLNPDKVKKLGTFKMEKLILKDTAPMKGNYLVLVVNLSDHEINQVRTHRSGADGSAWNGFVPIKQTCEYEKNPDKCIQEKKWAPLVALECGGTYNIDILAKDPMGIIRSAKAEKFQANCSSAGGVLVYK